MRTSSPKYLNSPETPIYSKGRTLYGLNLSKAAIRQAGFAVLVEGYFDFAQVYQAGFQAVVASCGTALTPRRPSSCGGSRQGRAELRPRRGRPGRGGKSCEMLVAEGFEVNVADAAGGRRSRCVRPQARSARPTPNA